jgi:ABC-type transporter Mla MlaB component
MFRITTQAADDELVLKLEGNLAGPWVRELDTCWHDVVLRGDVQRVRIDLTALCQVDAAGRELMAVMHRAGAQFVARGCVMPEVVREISASADAGLPRRSTESEGKRS